MVESEPFVSAAVIGEHLDLSPKTVYAMARRGEMPSYRVGGSVRFRISDIDAWLAAKVRGTEAVTRAAS